MEGLRDRAVEEFERRMTDGGIQELTIRHLLETKSYVFLTPKSVIWVTALEWREAARS
jgi:hypothetical protein